MGSRNFQQEYMALARSFTVKIHPRGPLWKRHWEQLHPIYGAKEDVEPGGADISSFFDTVNAPLPQTLNDV